MNKEVFNQLLKSPSKVNPKYKDELKTLVDTFPYSSSIRLLYLSSLLNDADVLFEEELKKTAAYITDRRILKKLIEPTVSKEDYIIPAPLKVVEKETKIEKGDEVEEVEPISKLDIVEVKEVEEIQDTPQEEVINEDIIEEVVVENINEVEKEIDNEIQESQDEKKSEISNKDSVNVLDELIIASAVDASLSIEIEEASAQIRKDKAEQKAKEDHSPKSFLEWIGGSEVESIKPNIDPKEQERIAFRKKAESLIDQFIDNQPKIKPKAEFYSPENMAQKSIEDSGEIVTETLAKVYATQGNIDKAKAIYEQLILNNPEKKSYFASLLKKLGAE